MNVSPISMNNTNNYSTKKLNNPNFKQVFIQKQQGIEEILKDKSVLKRVTDMAEILENASSNFFDSVINVDKLSDNNVFVSFFMKFKENFKWPWNQEEGIYASQNCNKDIGELKIPVDWDINAKKRIHLSYKDDKGTQHNCCIVPIVCSSYVTPGNYKIGYYDNDGPQTHEEDAVKLDELLNMMKSGEIYGENKGFSYKLKWHPFPGSVLQTRDMEYNKLARENALVSTDEEIQAVLDKYGK